MTNIIEMRPYSGFNKGHYYILTIINVLSKRGPYHSRSRSEMTNAIAEIVRESGRCPKNLQMDMEKEFYNADVQKILKKHTMLITIPRIRR